MKKVANHWAVAPTAVLMLLIIGYAISAAFVGAFDIYAVLMLNLILPLAVVMIMSLLIGSAGTLSGKQSFLRAVVFCAAVFAVETMYAVLVFTEEVTQEIINRTEFTENVTLNTSPSTSETIVQNFFVILSSR
jgi:hypothetical protein